MNLNVQSFGQIVAKYGRYILTDIDKEKEEVFNEIFPENGHEKDILIFVFKKLFEKSFFIEVMNRRILPQDFSIVILNNYEQISNAKINHTQAQITAETNRDELEHLNEKLMIVQKAKENSGPFIVKIINMYKEFYKIKE